jgi:hypothetical protein
MFSTILERKTNNTNVVILFPRAMFASGKFDTQVQDYSTVWCAEGVQK